MYLNFLANYGIFHAKFINLFNHHKSALKNIEGSMLKLTEKSVFAL